jgi:ABC-type multidrug transport system fused ATPase/permease subunit
MPFKYTVQAPDKVIFTRLESGCGRGVFIVVGSVFTIVGVCLLVFAKDPEMPLSMMRFLFPVMGVLAVIIGIRLPQIQGKTTPDSLVFDNSKGRVVVAQKASGIQSAFIYYDEIEHFIYKAKSQSTSNSSTTTTRRSYTYHVYLSKKDGGQWELLTCSNENDAMIEIVKLKALIRLDAKPAKETLAVTSSEKFSIKNYSSKSEISWMNPVGLGPLYLLMFAIVFCAVGYAILGSGFSDSDLPIFVYFVGGFIGVIFMVVVIGNAIKMFKNARTQYAVAVSDYSLEYIEKDLAGRIRKSTVFPMTDLHAISFSFDTDNTYRKIFIYTHDQFNKMKSMKISLSFEAIKEMYDFYSNLVSFEMQSLTAVEALYIENYIQQQIEERGHAHVE